MRLPSAVGVSLTVIAPPRLSSRSSLMVRLPPMTLSPLGLVSRRVAGVLAALCLIAVAATAQVGTTTDILTGTIRGPDGQPLSGALVTAMSLETQLSRDTKTNARGRYTIVFPDGGGQYRLTVRYIGLPQMQATVLRQADEDQLITDVALAAQPIELAPVTVRARRGQNGQGRPTPGETGQNLNPEMMARLPIDASDLNVLATLAPGVLGIGSTDSTDAAFSVAGLRPTANEVTLDGLQFGSGSVPQDAIRSTRVITSTYDVAKGEFSGGLVASTTKSGTNNPAGSWTYTLRDQSLSWGPGAGTSFTQAYTQQQFGGGFGGPLIHDKLRLRGVRGAAGAVALAAYSTRRSMRQTRRPSRASASRPILSRNISTCSRASGCR